MVSGGAIAVIPARGGSKRLPRKNVLPFRGKPMLAHSVDAALTSGLFRRIIVSTDDPEIAEAAVAAGAEVPFLRARHADDHAPVSLATIDAVRCAMDHFGEEYGVVVQLMANCPLRRTDAVHAAFTRFAQGDAPFLVSAFRFGWMNPWWAVRLDARGHPTPLFPQVGDARSQDLPPLYCPSGAVWLADRTQLESAGSFFGPGHAYFEIGWMDAVDIDDPEDLAFAEAVALMRAAQPAQGRS